MKVRFWGTRGSLAKPGPDTIRYGGNTSCIQVESDAGTLVVIDCGTGVHNLGQMLMAERATPLRGHILISHTHWDHIQGIPFFGPLFVAGNEWDFYAAQGFGESLQETLAGQMEYTYFPITLDALAATVRYHNLVEGVFQIADITVRTRYLNHPALTLGFRLEVDGAAVVYACDHEPHSRHLALAEGELDGEDREHAEFLRGADLVIHDAQYTAAEYPNKVGWGHSTVEYALKVAAAVGVKRLALTHHDPMRHDDAVDAVIAAVRTRIPAGSPIEVFGAAEGRVFELRGAPGAAAPESAQRSALRSAERDGERRVLLVGSDGARMDPVREAIRADGLQVELCTDAGAAREQFAALAPGLVIIDAELSDLSGIELARQLRQLSAGAELPIILISDEQHASSDPAVTDWLLQPFTREYVRTRVRAWLLRTRCRWMRPRVDEHEPQRLAALHALKLLDTPREQRFDRYARLAAALLEVPVAMISLVDEHRQWFKSCIGLEVSETGREVSFCAHAIHQRDLFVVADTLHDDRFADNPLVVDGPRVRFYAGRPLFLADGSCVGTLCVADQRPRQLTAEQRRSLEDLGSLVERELQQPTAN